MPKKIKESPRVIQERANAKLSTGYTTWNNETKQDVLKNIGGGIGVERTAASVGNSFQNIGNGGASIREEFSKSDYEYFRPSEASPKNIKEAINASVEAYYEFGIIHNIVNLMAEFAVQGIDLDCPSPTTKKFYQEWAWKVDFYNVSERIAAVALLMANIPVHKQLVSLSKSDIDELRRGFASKELSFVTAKKSEVPYSYNILNPITIEVLNEDLAQLLGKEYLDYGVKLPEKIIRKIKNPKTAEDKQLIALLPANLVKDIKDGKKIVTFDKDKFTMMFYKKFDWQSMAVPMLTPVLNELKVLRKLKQTDMSALDGAISHIRVWKLSDFERDIIAEDTTMQKLADIMLNNTAGGCLDLMWNGPLELIETSSNLAQFLGIEKYIPTLNAIYAGLGIPPTLTGQAGATAGGFTNNAISLETLIERLEYVRGIVRRFWENEFSAVQKSLGYKYPAIVTFDRMTLRDENTRLQLLLSMWDRGLISDESIQERFRYTPEVEMIRGKRENRMRNSGKLPPKASPFHNANLEGELRKIFAQSGAYTPSEFGVELEEKDSGEKPALLVAPPVTKAPGSSSTTTKQKGVPGQGRPKLKKDSKQRKQKVVKPRSTSASEEYKKVNEWVFAANNQLDEIIFPAYLKAVKKKTINKLTDKELCDVETYKFSVFCNIPSLANVTPELVHEISKGSLTIPEHITKLVDTAISKLDEKTPEKLKQIRLAVLTLHHGSY